MQSTTWEAKLSTPTYRLILFFVFVALVFLATSSIGRQFVVFGMASVLLLILAGVVKRFSNLGTLYIVLPLIIVPQAILLGVLVFDVHEKRSSPIGPFCHHWDKGQPVEEARVEAMRQSLNITVEAPFFNYSGDPIPAIVGVNHKTEWADCWCDIEHKDGQILKKPHPFCISPVDRVIAHMSYKVRLLEDYRTLE